VYGTGSAACSRSCAFRWPGGIRWDEHQPHAAPLGDAVIEHPRDRAGGLAMLALARVGLRSVCRAGQAVPGAGAGVR